MKRKSLTESFLDGIASVLSFGMLPLESETTRRFRRIGTLEDDAKALAADWRKVGADLQSAKRRVRKSSPEA